MSRATSAADTRLGLGMATMLVAGNLIGSGIYLLPATLGAIGSISIFGWIVAALGALVLAGVFSLISPCWSTGLRDWRTDGRPFGARPGGYSGDEGRRLPAFTEAHASSPFSGAHLAPRSRT